jgi:hypothetical protein
MTVVADRWVRTVETLVPCLVTSEASINQASSTIIPVETSSVCSISDQLVAQILLLKM